MDSHEMIVEFDKYCSTCLHLHQMWKSTSTSIRGTNRMMTKLQEGYYFLLVLLDAADMVWARTKRTLRDLLDILIALVGLLFDSRTLKNKLYALLLIGCTLPVMFLEGDATATVFVGFIAVPMFFAKESWVY